MTVYHSIVVNEHNVIHRSTTDVEKAESEEYYYRGKNYNTSSFGDINGDAYIVVYEHPKYQEDREKKKRLKEACDRAIDKLEEYYNGEVQEEAHRD